MYETKALDLDAVIKRYSPMVQRMAHQVRATVPPSVEIGDLIQAGLEGLLDAHRNYKAATGVPFEGYAHMKIRWFIMEELRRQDWLPKSMRDKRKALDAALSRANAASITGKVSEAEIAQSLDMDLPTYQKFLDEVSSAQVVYYEDFESGEAEFIENVSDRNSVRPEAAVEAIQLKKLISAAISKLPERQALVMSLYYEQDLTYREIADIIEMSIPRVSQLHTEAISRIRALSGLGPKK